MASDLRTSARDLMALAQKVGVVLQRHCDKLFNEVESAESSLSQDEQTALSDRCQHALDLRRQIRDSSKALKSALDHVEDIEDDDEPRILKKSMDTLQALVRSGLQIASEADAKAVVSTQAHSPEVTPDESVKNHTTSSSTHAISAKPGGMPVMIPGAPATLSGSIHRHPLGLFSTSPNFAAHTAFSTTARNGTPPGTSKLATTMSKLTTPTEAPSIPLPPPNIPTRAKESIKSTTQPKPSVMMAVDDGPLSIAATTPSPTTTKPLVKETRPSTRRRQGSDGASSILSSASFMTAQTSFSEAPPSTPSGTTHSKQPPAKLITDTVQKTTPPPSTQPRRVPRGLFTSSLASSGGDAPSFHSAQSHGSVLSSNGHAVDIKGKGIAVEFPPHPSTEARSTLVDNGPSSTLGMLAESTDSRSSASSPSEQNSSPTTSTATPASPSTFSPPPTPTSSGKPTSARVPPFKPTPIQTGPNIRKARIVYGRDDGDDGDERFAQLTKDLERAMNPTPTDPVPQPTFLQGSGLLERIPSSVSMDDGLLNEGEGHFESGEDVEHDNHDEETSLRCRDSTGSLRRQRSGSGKRQFRIGMPRSRSRSQSRRSRTNLTPIEIGYPAALTSSAWPFDRSPPKQTSLESLERQQRQAARDLKSNRTISTTSLTASQLLNRQLSSEQQHGPSSQRSLLSTRSREQQERVQRQWQHVQEATDRLGRPRLPFAESVTIENPVRIGRGIGSFTVYTVALTLCDPTASAPAAESAILPPRSPLEDLDQRDWGGSSRSNNNSNNSNNGNGNSNTQAAPRSQPVNGVNGSVVPPSSEGIKPDHRETMKPQSQASLMMMKRSYSFPELGSSAERLLQEMRAVEEEQLKEERGLWNSHRRDDSAGEGSSRVPTRRSMESSGVAVAVVGSRSGSGSGSRRAESSSTQTIQPQSQPSSQHPPRSHPHPTPSTAAPRIIRVRKRYSDFVVLRAQLVEMFKDWQRGAKQQRRMMNQSQASLTPLQRQQQQRAGLSQGGGQSFHGRPGYQVHGRGHGSVGGQVFPSIGHESGEGDEDEEDEEDEEEDDQGHGVRVRNRGTLALASPSGGHHQRSQSLPSMMVSDSNCILRGLPKLPPKKVVGKFRPAFVERRRRELEYFLEWVVAHPVIGDCPVVVQWFLGST